MFKLKAFEEAERKQKVLELKGMPDSMKAVINELKYHETGINFSSRDVAFDSVLITQFSSVEDLKAYIQHPEHQKVVKYLDTIKEKTAVVDYEL